MDVSSSSVREALALLESAKKLRDRPSRGSFWFSEWAHMAQQESDKGLGGADYQLRGIVLRGKPLPSTRIKLRT
jgi:hypothetical protein